MLADRQSSSERSALLLDHSISLGPAETSAALVATHSSRVSIGGALLRRRHRSRRGIAWPTDESAHAEARLSDPASAPSYSLAACARWSEACGTGRHRTRTGQAQRARRFANNLRL
jgi:hypothetical protein